MASLSYTYNRPANGAFTAYVHQEGVGIAFAKFIPAGSFADKDMCGLEIRGGADGVGALYIRLMVDKDFGIPAYDPVSPDMGI